MWTCFFSGSDDGCSLGQFAGIHKWGSFIRDLIFVYRRRFI